MTYIRVSARIIQIPDNCACCMKEHPDDTYLASFTRETGKKVIKRDGKGWNFPYCSKCLRHWSTAVSASFLLVLAILGAIGTGIALASFQVSIAVSMLGFGLSGAAFSLSLLLFCLAKSQRRAGCTSLFGAVIDHGWEGSVHSFIFANPEFSRAFKRANSNKLI